jgi:hypothetical protein
VYADSEMTALIIIIRLRSSHMIPSQWGLLVIMIMPFDAVCKRLNSRALSDVSSAVQDVYMVVTKSNLGYLRPCAVIVQI